MKIVNPLLIHYSNIQLLDIISDTKDELVLNNPEVPEDLKDKYRVQSLLEQQLRIEVKNNE